MAEAIEKISIAIPCYEMHGMGAAFLEFSLARIAQQQYANVEVLISDQSTDRAVEELCRSVQRSVGFELRYIRNERDYGNSSLNLNNALHHCTGKYIKVLFQDDFLYGDTALEKIVEAFRLNSDKHWLVSACAHSRDGHTIEHPFYPKYHDGIHLGENTISSPSVLSLRNESLIYFDPKLIWLMDVEYYKRLYQRFSKPIILEEVGVVNRLWDKQLSNTISEQVKEDELCYVRRKHQGPGQRLLERLRAYVSCYERGH